MSQSDRNRPERESKCPIDVFGHGIDVVSCNLLDSKACSRYSDCGVYRSSGSNNGEELAFSHNLLPESNWEAARFAGYSI